MSALPAPQSWRDILGLDLLFPGELSAKEAKATVSVHHKTRLRAACPATAGSSTTIAELNAAKDAAFAELDGQ